MSITYRIKRQLYRIQYTYLILYYITIIITWKIKNGLSLNLLYFFIII